MAFDTHIADNDNLFNQMTATSTSLGGRISDLETRSESFAKDGATLEKRVAAAETMVSSLDTRAADVARDGAKTVEEIANIYAKIQVVHDVVNGLGAHLSNLTEQASKSKGDVDALELRTSQIEIKVDGMSSECQGFMAKLVEHEKALKNMPNMSAGDGDGHAKKGDWAGVAGSRLFTARVKEYAGPSNVFQSWAVNFKSNIPKEMRDALDWAERLTVPITVDLVKENRHEEWEEEAWRCLAGVLRGQWETLKNTLKSGQGLELWRQLVAGHVTRSPDHADSIHQALHKMQPAKDLSDVRHKIHQVKAGIIRHDELASEPMQDGSKRTLYMRILPKDVAKHLAMQARPVTVEDLLDRVMKYITDMGGFEATMGITPVSMDLVALGPDSDQAKEMAAMRQELRALGAMVGKGGGQGGKPGKGTWGSYNSQRSGGGKAGRVQKGGDRGGAKGKNSSVPVGSPAAEARRGARICHAYQETGKCWHMDTFGHCKFKHVKGIPPALSSVEGLRFEDLVGNLKYDKGAQVYTYTAEPAVDKDIKTNVEAEIAAIVAELEELGDEEEAEPGAQPFQRH